MTDQPEHNQKTTDSGVEEPRITWNSGLLLWNVYLTQCLMLGLGLGLLWFQDRLSYKLFGFGEWKWWLWGVGVGLLVVSAEWILSHRLPEKWMDDGGINRLLFQNLSIPHIAWISALVAVSEEILFRGVLQHWFGLVGTALLFTLIHFRYLKQWLLVTLLFLISLLLGWLVEWSNLLTPAIATHFVLDFVWGVLIRTRKFS